MSKRSQLGRKKTQEVFDKERLVWVDFCPVQGGAKSAKKAAAAAAAAAAGSDGEGAEVDDEAPSPPRVSINPHVTGLSPLLLWSI